jgi:hypothetical protein
VIVVARSGRTEAASAARTTELLDRVGATPVGAVLVAAPEPRSSYYSYTQYYGGRQAARPMPTGPDVVTVGPGTGNGEWATAGDDGTGAGGPGGMVPANGSNGPGGGTRTQPERPRTLARSLADFLLRYDERERYER